MTSLSKLVKIKPALYVAAAILVVVIPVALTLNTVKHPLHSELTSSNPTPLGYSTSLLLFVLPVLIIAYWFFTHPKINFQKPALLITLSLLAPLGVILDILFAHSFFTFENSGAVTGWSIPGVGGDIPLEEIIFYVSGFAFVLLLYMWGDEFWLDRYNVPDYTSSVAGIGRILRFHGSSFLIASLLIVAAIIYKKMFSDVPEGMPWYWIYLTLIGMTPAIGFFHGASPFINWRSLSFTIVVVVLVSIIWEVTLALPYQWWDYQHRQMMGVFIKAWHDLPIEAAMLWISVGYSSIIIYETVKIWLATKKSLRLAFIGA